MSKKININRADKEELMSLKDIGEKRALLIIKERQNKGQLNLESLKSIQGIPSNLWDPLVMSGKISFDEEDKEDETMDSTHSKQLVDKFKTETLILKQAEVTLTKEKNQLANGYKNKLKDYKQN